MVASANGAVASDAAGWQRSPRGTHCKPGATAQKETPLEVAQPQSSSELQQALLVASTLHSTFCASRISRAAAVSTVMQPPCFSPTSFQTHTYLLEMHCASVLASSAHAASGFTLAGTAGALVVDIAVIDGEVDAGTAVASPRSPLPMVASSSVLPLALAMLLPLPTGIVLPLEAPSLEAPSLEPKGPCPLIDELPEEPGLAEPKALLPEPALSGRGGGT